MVPVEISWGHINFFIFLAELFAFENDSVVLATPQSQSEELKLKTKFCGGSESDKSQERTDLLSGGTGLMYRAGKL